MVVVGNPASESNFTTWKVESSWDIETFLISNRLVSYRRYPWIVVGRILLPFRCNKVQGYECSRRSWKTAFYHWHLDGTANILQNEWWMVNDVSRIQSIAGRVPDGANSIPGSSLSLQSHGICVTLIRQFRGRSNSVFHSVLKQFNTAAEGK